MNEHPAIERCSYVRIPNSNKTGFEIVKLYILLKKGYEVNEEIKTEISEHAQDNLAKNRVPKIIKIMDQLPQ